MVAAALAAVVALPARRSLDELAQPARLRRAPRRPTRRSRPSAAACRGAVPMDELLLQLAESLKLSMQLETAEVWTGTDGVLERVVSVPDRGPRRLVALGRGAARRGPGPGLGQRVAAGVGAGAGRRTAATCVRAGRAGRRTRASCSG